MKRSKIRSLFAMLLVCIMALSLTACGGGSGEDSGALTEEEYEAAVTKLGEDFTAIQTDAAGIDPTDMDAAMQLLEDCKAPLEEFIAIVPPEAYAAAHEKLQSGSQSMIDYLDTVISMMNETDPTKLQEAAETMMEQVTTATNDLMEGSSMLEEAAN